MREERREEEYFAKIGEKLKKAGKEAPEKFPFKPGERVFVTGGETGELEAAEFLGWDPKTGKAIVTVKEGKKTMGTKLVEKENLLHAA